jgi:hypothetical protein
MLKFGARVPAIKIPLLTRVILAFLSHISKLAGEEVYASVN